MRLELGLVHIKDIHFGSRTVIEDHVLFIDRQELISVANISGARRNRSDAFLRHQA